MTFTKGQSGNPKGRPPKERALTAILERAGAATQDVKGKPVSGKQLIARLVWEAATTGRITFPDGRLYELADGEDWFSVVKFIYSHIDGPAKATVELGSDPARPLIIHRRPDLTALSDEELALLEGLLNKGADAGGD